jgi:mono/diheme cytochrome c family protein
MKETRPTLRITTLATILLTIALALTLGIPMALAQEGAEEELPKGVGPIESIELGPIDEQLVAAGQETYDLLCSACHKIESRYIGPALLGVTERRAPEWIMNMILAPDVMIQEDETAFALYAEYLSPMANQGLTEEQARAILEYFRSVDAANAAEGE